MKNYKYNNIHCGHCDGQLYSSLRARRKQIPAISSVETLEVMIQKLVQEYCEQ